MRISDWSSDVCSSDLNAVYIIPAAGSAAGSAARPAALRRAAARAAAAASAGWSTVAAAAAVQVRARRAASPDRKSGVEGKGVEVGVILGCSRIHKKKKKKQEDQSMSYNRITST